MVLSFDAHQRRKEITPEVLESAETGYNRLVELMAAGLTWHAAVKLYANCLEQGLRGDVSLPLRTAEEAASYLKGSSILMARK